MCQLLLFKISYFSLPIRWWHCIAVARNLRLRDISVITNFMSNTSIVCIFCNCMKLWGYVWQLRCVWNFEWSKDLVVYYTLFYKYIQAFKRKWTSRLLNHLLHIFIVPDFSHHLIYISWCTGKCSCSVRELIVFTKIQNKKYIY